MATTISLPVWKERNVTTNPGNRNLLGSGIVSDEAPLTSSSLNFPSLSGLFDFCISQKSFTAAQKHCSTSWTKGPKYCKDILERSGRKHAKPDLLRLNLFTKTTLLSLPPLCSASTRGRWKPSSFPCLVILAAGTGRATTGLWEGACPNGTLFEQFSVKGNMIREGKEKWSRKLWFISSELVPAYSDFRVFLPSECVRFILHSIP